MCSNPVILSSSTAFNVAGNFVILQVKPIVKRKLKRNVIPRYNILSDHLTTEPNYVT